jgi:hypothetical protein
MNGYLFSEMKYLNSLFMYMKYIDEDYGGNVFMYGPLFGDT